MITFNEFLEHKSVESTIRECAHLMAEMDVEPHRYIYECLKEIDPVLAEGWMDGIRDFAGRAWNAAKQIGGSVWDGGGLKHGLKQAADTVAGPVAKFDAVERALTDLVKLLNTDEKLKKFKTSAPDYKGHTVGEYLARVLASLQQDKAAIPQIMQTQVKQKYGTRQDVEDQAGTGAAPATPSAQPLSAAGPARNRPQMRSTGTNP